MSPREAAERFSRAEEAYRLARRDRDANPNAVARYHATLIELAAAVAAFRLLLN